MGIDSSSDESAHPTRGVKLFGDPHPFFESPRNQVEITSTSLIRKSTISTTNGSCVSNPICLDDEMVGPFHTAFAQGIKHGELSKTINISKDHFIIDGATSMPTVPITSKSNLNPLVPDAESTSVVTSAFAQGLLAKRANQSVTSSEECVSRDG